MTTHETDLVLTETFDAPLATVWRAWTEPGALARWWGPPGGGVQVGRFDLRPGGMFVYGMKTPTGDTMWGRKAYREIVEGQRLVYTTAFSDADGTPMRAPFAADFPLEILSTVSFSESGGTTTVTAVSRPDGATDVERAFFAQMREQMRAGTLGMLAQLRAFLAA